MGRKRDKEREEERKLKRKAGIIAKRGLAADLREDLGSYNKEIWVDDMESVDSVDGEEAVLVEALLTSQHSTPVPKGKKKRQYNNSEEEDDDDDYYDLYLGSEASTPKKPQEGPSKSNISIPDIEFEHPTAAGMSDHKTYPGSFGLDKFIAVMANELELPPKSIQLAYRLSTEPKSRVPHRLATDENWDRMVGSVQDAQIAESKKASAKRRKVIVLIAQAKKTESGGAAKSPMKPPRKKIRLDSSTEEAGASGTAEDPLKTKVDWMVKLQTQHRCKTGLHPSSSIGCLYLGPNQCTPFQPGDLSEWAMALALNKAGVSLTQPPVSLNLDAPARTHRPPNAQPGIIGNDWSRYGYSHPPWPLVPPPLPQFTAPSQQSLGASTSSFLTSIPSSDSVTEDNQPIYPTISAWFQELDHGTGRGSIGYNFSSFVEAFDKVGIKSLHHLFDPYLFPNGLTLDALRGYVDSLSPGAAAALIKYAKKDKRKYKERAQNSVQ